jgi:hypothetical protein
MSDFLTTRRTFLAVLFFGLLAMASRNVTDPDVWWHLKTGQSIAEHWSVPHTDPFSYTHAGQPWVAHEWLTDLAFYSLFRATCWGGLILVSALVLVGAFSLVYLRCADNPYLSGVITLSGAWTTIPLWGVRPQILSLLLTSLWWLILERSERNPKLLFWTLPLTLLWVNLHAGFALGLALIALFLVGELIECAIGQSLINNVAPRLRALGLTLLLDLLLVPFNPNGLRMYAYPIETLRSPAMQNYIAEWAPPNFHRAEYWLLLFLLLAILAAAAWSLRHIRTRDFLLLSVGIFSGLSSIRMIPIFILAAVPILSRLLSDWTRNDRRMQVRPVNRGLLNASIILAMAAFAGVHASQIIHHQPQAEIQSFPALAVDFLKAYPPAGPVFNHYDWGGYLIWRLYPSDKVFIDGRADLYGDAFMHQFAETYQLKGSWYRTLEDRGIQTVLVPPESPIATGLRRAPGWTASYEDPRAVVFTLSVSAKRLLTSPMAAVQPKPGLPEYAIN